MHAQQGLIESCSFVYLGSLLGAFSACVSVRLCVGMA